MSQKQTPARRALQTLALLGLLAAGSAWAQSVDVLAKVRSNGAVTLGVRASSVPMSFMSGGTASGYVVDVCRAIVGRLMPGARISYFEVLPQNRTNAVQSGQIDLDCGAIVDVPSRRESVSFSAPVFLEGGRVLTSKKLRLQRLDELGSAKVSFATGTVSDRQLRSKLGDKAGFQAVYANGWSEAVDMVLSGQTEAVAGFDITLATALARANANSQVNWIDEPYSQVDTIAIAFHKDDLRLKSAVDGALASMVASKELSQIYARWFQSRLDNGLEMSLAPSEAMRRLLGVDASAVSNPIATPASSGRDDPKVFGRSARGG